jgi:tRNA(fMet)-specific endonuclease VapC
MLDTNTVSLLIRENKAVVRRVVAVPMASLCISAITQGELLFGLARRPAATRLHRAVRELLRRVDVLPWDRGTAERHGAVRADIEHRGRVLAPLDLLIATHALAVGTVLVTSDHAFAMVAGLEVENWALA